MLFHMTRMRDAVWEGLNVDGLLTPKGFSSLKEQFLLCINGRNPNSNDSGDEINMNPVKEDNERSCSA